MRHPSERKENRGTTGATRYLCSQILLAVTDLVRTWLVLNRQALDCVGDHYLINEREFFQGRKKQISRCVTGKRYASTISAMFARRQPKDNETRIRISTPWHRQVPVVRMLLTQLSKLTLHPYAAAAFYKWFHHMCELGD